MTKKPTYEELQQRVKELEKETALHKQIEGALRDSEKRSRAWLEHSPVCTKIVDGDFNLQFMSSAGVEDLQIDDITQFYGKPYPISFYPDSFRRLMTKNLEVAKETGKVITQEQPVADIEGNELWYHSTIVPGNNDEDQFEYLIVISIETTDRQQAEGALKKAHDELEQEVEERTNKLFKANEQLKREIEERKRVEVELRESELRFKILLNSLNDVAWAASVMSTR